MFPMSTNAIENTHPARIMQENPSKVLTYAHFYLIDHLISTLYIVFFGVTWYSYTPHDGRRIANSAAQKEILEAGLAASAGGAAGHVDDAERGRMALQVWNDEKGFSTTVLILGWLIKVGPLYIPLRFLLTYTDAIPIGYTCFDLVLHTIVEQQIYFIAVLYSYAIHLRRGTFRALLNSQQAQAASKQPSSSTSSSSNNARRTTSGNGYAYSHLRNSSNGGANGESVLWQGELEDGENDLPRYSSAATGREEQSSRDKNNR